MPVYHDVQQPEFPRTGNIEATNKIWKVYAW